MQPESVQDHSDWRFLAGRVPELASCSTSPIRPKNSMKTDNPPKGVTARSVSQILIFPPPKSGLNSCQSFCFCTTLSLINAWNRMRLSYHTPTSDFRLKNQEENGAGKICYCPIRRISHEYASHRNYSRSAGFRLHNHPVGRRTTNDVRWIGSLIVSEKAAKPMWYWPCSKFLERDANACHTLQGKLGSPDIYGFNRRVPRGSGSPRTQKLSRGIHMAVDP